MTNICNFYISRQKISTQTTSVHFRIKTMLLYIVHNSISLSQDDKRNFATFLLSSRQNSRSVKGRRDWSSLSPQSSTRYRGKTCSLKIPWIIPHQNLRPYQNFRHSGGPARSTNAMTRTKTDEIKYSECMTQHIFWEKFTGKS